MVAEIRPHKEKNGEMGGGERGREGGGVDLNLGTPEPVLSDKPPPPPCGGLLLSVGEARRSEKEVVMKGYELLKDKASYLIEI